MYSSFNTCHLKKKCCGLQFSHLGLRVLTHHLLGFLIFHADFFFPSQMPNFPFFTSYWKAFTSFCADSRIFQGVHQPRFIAHTGIFPFLNMVTVLKRGINLTYKAFQYLVCSRYCPSQYLIRMEKYIVLCLGCDHRVFLDHEFSKGTCDLLLYVII